MRILYFAKISDQLGKKQDKLIISDRIKIKDLVKILIKKNKKYSIVFKNISGIKFAVNCEYVSINNYVCNEDELAIFPPVTGG